VTLKLVRNVARVVEYPLAKLILRLFIVDGLFGVGTGQWVGYSSSFAALDGGN